MLRILKKRLASTWRVDLVAGLSVAVVTVPQSLAHASLAGLPAHIGLYASFLPTIVAAVFGSSMLLVTGPVAVVSLLTLTVLMTTGVSAESFVVMASLLALLVGLVQVLMSRLRLGLLINYVSHPVVLGFTNAAALIIAASQLPKFLGIKIAPHEHFYQTFLELFSKLELLHLPTFIFGASSLVGILVLKKYKPRWPAVLIVVATAIFTSQYIGFTGAVVGEIPKGLPHFSLSFPSLAQLRLLISGAVAIALVSYMEGVSIAKSLARKNHQKLDANKELLAQGLANIASSISGGYPVSGSFSRTALNDTAGAKTKLAAGVVGFMSLFTLLFLTPIFYFLPQSVLAAIIMVAVLHLVDLKALQDLLSQRRRDGLAAFLTLGVSIIFAPHLDYGILAGVIVSVVMLAHRSAASSISIFSADDRDQNLNSQYKLRSFPSNKYVVVVVVDKDLLFTNSEQICTAIKNAVDESRESSRYVLILGRSINHIDAHADQALEELKIELKTAKVKLIFAGLKPAVRLKLSKSFKKNTFFPRANDALRSVSEWELQ